MEDKIEVGEYVRTKRGIGKIIEIKTVQTKMYGKHNVVYLIDKCPHMYITETEFIKHSNNIKDIVEKNDFINGMQVDEFDDEEGNIYLGFPIYDDALMDCITEVRPLSSVEIGSIVTHEQFDAIEYVVKGEKEC